MATNQTFVDYQTPIPADWLNNVNNKVNILANKGTNIASAAAINLGAATGDYVVITGTTTITSLGTADAGTERTLVFSGVLTLTHNATSLILPGGVDIVTDVGDIATFRSEGSGNWRCTGCQPNINGLKSNLLLSFNVGGAEAMRIDTSRNVGIGGASGGAKLDVFGNQRICSPNTSSAFTGLSITNTNTAGGTSYIDFQGVGGVTDSGILVYHATDYSSHISFGTQPAGAASDRRTNKLAIDGVGNVLALSPTGCLGYGVGAGGTVTQSTSKSTAVTLNKPCGQITMNNAAMTAGASVTFNLNNSLLATSDGLVVCPVNIGNYRVEVAAISSGVAQIRVTNITAGSLSEALIINFAIIKGATS